MDLVSTFEDPTYIAFIEGLNEDKLEIKGNIANNKWRLPIYKSVFEEIKTLRKQRQELMKRYHDIYELISYSDKPPSRFKKEYDDIYNKLYETDAKIMKLIAYYRYQNTETMQAQDEDSMQYKYLNTKEELTVKEARELAILFKKTIESYNTTNKSEIEFFIDTLPSKKGSHKPKPILYEKNREIVLPQEHKEIEENIAKLIAKTFKFKNVDECKSSKRSQSYYMSKENILKEVDSNERIRQVLPKNYKSLTKEKICEHLFFEDG